MHYEGNIIRPPSEAGSIILQVTTGCSHNKCTFCGAYKGLPFSIKIQDIVESDLEFAKKYCRNQNRLFLADGDVLILSQKRLTELLKKIQNTLPWVNKISLYGNGKAIRSKTVEQLCELKKLGLDRIYMGLESGCDEVLHRVGKGETAEKMVFAAQRVREAGLFLSVTALLGLGGKELSIEHALKTAAVLNRMQPKQVAILTLMVLDNTPLATDVASQSFTILSAEETLEELLALVKNLDGFRCQFHANHASSYLPLAGRLPKDKDRLIEEISLALSRITPLVPEHRRAL